MTASMISLGRETPFHIQDTPQDNQLLVTYSDALVLFELRENGQFEVLHQARGSHQDSAILSSKGGYWRAVSVGEQRLEVFTSSLDLAASAEGQGGEDLTMVFVTDSGLIVTVNEALEVRCWSPGVENELSLAGEWMVECQPLFAKVGGKSLVCSERGRLQERDTKTGTVLRTWPKTTTAVWGVTDRDGHHAVTINEDGQASLWDLSSREVLFGLDSSFPVGRACFQGSGLSGALLGSNGEVSLFKVTDGGGTLPVEVPKIPLVSLTFLKDRLFGLDENGGIWELSQDLLSLRGGVWAGWATASCALDSERLTLGTASGSVEVFKSDGCYLACSVQAHEDAVLALEKWGDGILSIGADASVVSIMLGDTGTLNKTELVSFPGRTVVDHALCLRENRLWLALDEGLLVWVSLGKSGDKGEIQLEDRRRIEEIRVLDSGSLILVTDRGSVKFISVS